MPGNLILLLVLALISETEMQQKTILNENIGTQQSTTSLALQEWTSES